MSRINTNIAAIKATNRMGVNQADLRLRLERLATGLRINRGADDPAGLIVSETLRSEINGLRQAVQNSVRADNVITTAEGAMNEVSALLLDLQSLIVQTANEAGLSNEEVAANQLSVDSILDSIDRIARTTTFAGKRLLDGSQAYLLSGVAPNSLASVEVFAAHVPNNGSRQINVAVTQSAQTAQVSLIGTNPGGTSQTAATTIVVRGNSGSQMLSFAAGTTLADVRTAINDSTAMTGVSAIVSAPAIGAAASALLLNSANFGSDAFVSVEPMTGDFVASGNSGSTIRDVGVDVGVNINGRTASSNGLRADVRTRMLDTRIHLTSSFGQALGTSTFDITGGGALFQLGPEVKPAGQIFVGMENVDTTKLGNSTIGFLYTLRSGHVNDFASKNFEEAQDILGAAIDQTSSYRGRLGSVQKDHIESNINAQNIAIENVTASESSIRDADMAVEVSALTRAQVLVESTQQVLQIANSLPRLVLSLLQ